MRRAEGGERQRGFLDAPPGVSRNLGHDAKLFGGFVLPSQRECKMKHGEARIVFFFSYSNTRIEIEGGGEVTPFNCSATDSGRTGNSNDA